MDIKRNFSKVFMAVLVTMSIFVNLIVPADIVLACGTSLKTTVSAEASWTQLEKFDWDFEKNVNECSATLALGDEKDFEYTVRATRIPAGTDSQVKVTGLIEITNCGDEKTEDLTVKARVLYKTDPKNPSYEILTDLNLIATDVLQSGEKKEYSYSIEFTPVEDATSYKVAVQTTLTNYVGHVGEIFGPGLTYEVFQLPSYPTLTVEDETASVNDEMITDEMNTAGFAVSSKGDFPWTVDETNLEVGEDGIGRAEQNYKVTVTNNSAESNKTFTLYNKATLTESSTEEPHDADVAVAIKTEEAEGGILESTVSASGFWNRKLVYDWAITKTAEPTSLNLAPGSSGTVNYSLHALRTLTEDFVEVCGVAGTINVNNTGNATTENLQINVQVMAKIDTDYHEIAGATQVITPAEQLAADIEGNYNYNINFIPLPGAEYKVVARMTIDNYAGMKSVPHGPSIEQPFTLPVAPEETREDHIAVVQDEVSSLEGFTVIGGLTSPWEITEADLVVDEKGHSATKNYAVTITNTSAQADSTFELINMVTLTEEHSKVEQKDQAKVTIVTPEEQDKEPGELTDSDDSEKDSDDTIIKSERRKKRSSNKKDTLPTEEITPPQDEAPMTPQLPTEELTPPQDEEPNNILPVPEKNPADENPVPQEEITPPVQQEPQLPYTGGPTGLFVTMGMMLVLYGNRLRRK